MQQGNVQNNSTVDKTTYSIFNAFSKAIQKSDQDSINALIQKEDILSKTFYWEKKTFLHVAAKFGNEETVLRICELGADVNALKRNKETPLYNAIINSPAIVQILINNGARVDIMCENEITPLRKALLCGTGETVKLFVNKLLPGVDGSHKEEADIDEIVKLLLTHKSKLNLVIMDYPLLLFFAAKIGRDDIFELVLNDCKDSLKSSKDVAKGRNAFWQFGEVNFQGHFGRTALFYAVHQQLPQVVHYLVKKGACVNITSLDALTPLHFALFNDNEPICGILLKFGAHLSLDFWRKSTFQRSTLVRPTLKCDMFHDDKCVINETITINFHPRIAKLLLRSGFNPNIFDNQERTPLLEAIKTENLEAFKMLVEFGANVKIKDSDGNSALHYAAQGDSFEMVDLLLERGLDIDCINKRQFTPLMFMVLKGGNSKMLEHLVFRGADINARNNRGATALHITAFSNCTELTECLLELGADKAIECKPRSSVDDSDIPNSSQKAIISYIALRNGSLANNIRSYIQPAYLRLAFAFLEKCKIELERLKSVNISPDSRLSLYDLLFKNLYQWVRIVGNVDIGKILKTSRFIREFPCYFGLLKRRLAIAESLKEAVEKTEKFFQTYQRNMLPDLVVRSVLSYLNSLDFQRFGGIFMKQEGQKSGFEVDEIYKAKIVEVEKDGVLVTLGADYSNIFLRQQQVDLRFIQYSSAVDLEAGDEIEVRYFGSHPESGQMVFSTTDFFSFYSSRPVSKK